MDAFTSPNTMPGDTQIKILGVVDNVAGGIAEIVALHNGFAGVDLAWHDAYLMAQRNSLITRRHL